MKRFLLLAAAAAAFVLPAAAQAQDQSRLHKILAAGELRVGTTGDWNPMSMRDVASNNYTGFDIELTQELAKDLGVEVKYVPSDWKTIVQGIVADKYDISTSASITTQRIKATGFTRPYFKVGTVPLTLKKNLDRFTSWESINQDGVTVSVTLGTSQEQQVKTLFPSAKIRSIEAPARDYQEVLAGRADVSVTSNVEAATLIQTFPEMAIVPVDGPRRPAELAFMVDQDDTVWLNYLNHWISIKQAQGFFDELQAKWLPTS